jgi:hypothetical protein
MLSCAVLALSMLSCAVPSIELHLSAVFFLVGVSAKFGGILIIRLALEKYGASTFSQIWSQKNSAAVSLAPNRRQDKMANEESAPKRLKA